MYTLIGYYTAPERRRNLFGLFFGGEGKLFCRLNPQLYREGDTLPIKNIGVYELNLGDNDLPKSDLEEFLISELKEGMEQGIEVGGVIIPAENITVTVELSESD